MRVAPYAPFNAFLIPVGNVHAAHKACYAVDDNNLAVVAIVHFAGEDGECNSQKGIDLDACGFHLVEKTLLYMPTPHVVI